MPFPRGFNRVLQHRINFGIRHEMRGHLPVELNQACHTALRQHRIQSCRVSFLRRAEALSLRSLFHEAKMGLKAYPPPDRRFGDRKLRRFKPVLAKRYRDAEVEMFASKQECASGDLFTLTQHPGVGPINNHAEKKLREPIAHRKIRRQLKSETGMAVFSRMMTAVPA